MPRLTPRRFFLVAVLSAVATWLLWPSPIDPVATSFPPGEKLEGRWAPTGRLARARVLARDLPGPEDVWIDADGTVISGLADGRVVKVNGDGEVTTLAQTDGRPLGLTRAPDGRLLVADARRGLLAVDDGGTIEVLLTDVDGTPLGFADHLDVSREGVVYLSDASTKFGEGRYMYDLFEGRPHGRLVEFDLQTRQARVVLDDLYFANGVAVSADDSFVLVNETYAYRIRKLWRTGERAGTSEVLIDRLPGFPDNLSRDPDGTFWVGFFTIRNPVAAWLGPRPYVRDLVAKLPSALWPKPAEVGLVARVSGEGEILEVLVDREGASVKNLTGVRASKERLVFGTLLGDRIWELPRTAD